MAARSLLLKLEARGWIVLPPRQRRPSSRMGIRAAVAVALTEPPLTQPLAALLPLVITEVSTPTGAAQRPLFEALLRQHHYLGYRGWVGQNLQYLVGDVQARPLACVLFGAAAWQCAHRDQYIGWDAATRLGLQALSAQLYREALARGLGQAKLVLVIADGALWIWNLAKDRFPQARQRLDLFHADEHLWAMAHDLYGHGTPEAQAWVAPLLQQIRDDETAAVIASLTELKPRLLEIQQKKVQTQIEHFQHNAARMKYKEVLEARKACEKGSATAEQQQLANHPVGSGAMESTCRQYQCRFKRTGQFWTTPGDEALMCLETLWRNGRWHELYPHAKSSAGLN